MRTHRVVRLLAAAVMLAAVVRPYGNPTVCGVAGHEPAAEAEHHHAPSHGMAATAQAPMDSCHEQMGCGLASLGLALTGEPDIPTLQEHAEVTAVGAPALHSALLAPTTPPPRA